jgi:peptidoglycan/xylan/chitin deacetylase (PgdA/CDA1 family)
MKTIIWDVDPRDWSNPGTGEIQSTVLGTVRRGSIVVLHDGPASRAQTVAALPGILRGLRRRHLRAVTVTRLLHGRLVYR